MLMMIFIELLYKNFLNILLQRLIFSINQFRTSVLYVVTRISRE